MKALGSLLLLLGLAFIVDRYAQGVASLSQPATMRTAMNLGLLMLGAWLTGILFNHIRLPRISGYLIYGVIVGPFMLGLIGREQVSGLSFISDLAVALIALTAGGEIRFQWLRGQMRSVSLIAVVIIFTVWIVMGATVFFAEQFIPLIKDAPLSHRVGMAVLAGLIAASNSPAVVIAMINEYDAHGPLARMTLAATIVKDMLMVVAFAAALAVTRSMVDEQTTLSAGFLAAITLQLIGSIVLGAILGVVMAFYVHVFNAHLAIFLIGSCMLFALMGEQHFYIAGTAAHLEPLLLGLSAGLVMRNLWEEQTEPLFETVEDMSLPVYCLFFALVGAKMDMSILISAWVLVVTGFFVRAGTIWGCVSFAARWTPLELRVRRRLWMGFIPQAGVSLAFIALIQSTFNEESHVLVENVLLGIIALNELIGPVCFRYALLSTGEAQTAGFYVSSSTSPQRA